MDWTNVSDTRTVDLAIIRLPATVPVTDPSYGGPVLINPGGPGGSGVGMALKQGRLIQTIVSAPTSKHNSTEEATATGKHFDVMSFDPRGVNNTTPSFNCFMSSVQMYASELESAANSALESSDAAFGIEWARQRALADVCSKRALESGIGEFVTTPSVARDMIEMIERAGQWREKEAEKLLAASSHGSTSKFKLWPGSAAQNAIATAENAQSAVLERTKYVPDQEKLQYWGFSYGTILGATLSAMFPSRISRAVLDGVCDSFDYMKGGWLTNLQDTDMQIIKFGEYCWLGGPENCALYSPDGPAAIVDTFAQIIADLKANPIGVPAQDGRPPEVATNSDLKQLFMTSSYNPTRYFHSLAKTMNEVRQGNATGLVQGRLEKRKFIEEGTSIECKEQGPYSQACFDASKAWDISHAQPILCTDADDQTNMTKAEYWEYVEELMGQSRLLGDVWGRIRLPCTQWNIRPKWRYTGPYTAQTAHPILFVSNTADNVTPLRNAIRMARGFPGSTILQQDSEGHCSSSAVSMCTAKAIRRYFQTGELPASPGGKEEDGEYRGEGKVSQICTPDRRPLDGFSEEDDPTLPKGETDGELWRALVAANRD
ncbi:hypothetical protein AAFC00_004385 [Neodothiora populina]